MTFWQLKYKFRVEGDYDDEIHDAEIFFEDPEQAMAYVIDNRKDGVDIFDIHLTERHTAIWRSQVVLNGKEED